LVATGNMGGATEAIASMVARDPFYRPQIDDVPPRLRSVVSDARRRLLPSIVQDMYLRAKTAFDRSDFEVAKNDFAQVLLALSDPDLADTASHPPLADLRLLAAGFNELAASRAMAPPAPPPVAALPEPSVIQPARISTRIYSADDADVSAPVSLRQNVPAFPGRVTMTRTGVVDVVIDDTGAVETAAMSKALDPVYDRIVLAAARTWAYSPARLEGAPVKYRKRIQIALSLTR
jgi:hypothetical protein